MSAPILSFLAHRGLWGQMQEQNSYAACEAALRAGYGIEIDIRDRDGRLVVAHEPDEPAAYPFEDICRLLADFPHGCAAINIKSCGLQPMLKNLLERYAITHYFTFDMALPDMLANLRHGITSFTRQSDHEPEPLLYAQSAGVWLDRFASGATDMAVVRKHLRSGKSVAIVSPELHRHSHDLLWQKLKDAVKMINPEDGAVSRLYLCTDHPQEAQRFFDA